jgi:hypothetical protein
MKRARLFTPISFFPRSRGKMKKGDRKGSSDFDGSTDHISKESAKDNIPGCLTQAPLNRRKYSWLISH